MPLLLPLPLVEQGSAAHRSFTCTTTKDQEDSILRIQIGALKKELKLAKVAKQFIKQVTSHPSTISRAYAFFQIEENKLFGHVYSFKLFEHVYSFILEGHSY
jgi:hypothetical protein